MSSSGDERASSGGGVDLRLPAAVSELRVAAAVDDNLELRPPSSCLDLQFWRWNESSSGGESLAAAVHEQGAISLLARSPEFQSIKIPKGRDVEDDDTFVFNDQFTAPIY
nr:cullin-4-like [Ipomoea batatas]